ncbi:MAG: sel1 repeat family protein [Campylobacteraceae bacterium]|jgi:TPR repeat protein|nr:sel1 repeat family protein [Campylobacteraceae bacterium]
MKKRLLIELLLFCTLAAVIICISKLYYSAENTLLKRCDGSDTMSCYALASLYENQPQAVTYLKKGCDANHLQSCRYLGDLYIDANNANDLTYIQKACNYNNTKACFTIGQMSKNDNKSSNETIAYFKKSCENGNMEGCFEIASMYVSNKYDYENGIAKAFYIFTELCEKNNYEACYNLGKLYHKNEYIKYKTRLVYALRYYKLACDKGEVEASCKALESLNNYVQDILKLRKLCSLNDAYSCNRLANIYASPGTAIDYDYATAAKFYKKSCDELNDKEACSRIVNYYHWISDDVNKLKYAAKNCDEGKISFCSTAADLYLYSEHSYNVSFDMADRSVLMSPDPLISNFVPKDINKAIYYLQKACDKNSKDECNSLGDIYSQRSEVKNTEKAVIYYKKACGMGYERSCENLKSLEKYP